MLNEPKLPAHFRSITTSRNHQQNVVNRNSSRSDGSPQRYPPVYGGRIQRNRRPACAYVNRDQRYPLPNPRDRPRLRDQELYSRHICRLDDMRCHRIDHVLANIQRAPPPAQLRARAPLLCEYKKEEVNAENIHRVTTLQLLRCRYRTLPAQTKRMW